MSRFSFKAILYSLLACSFFSLNVFAKKLTILQKQELFNKGTITVHDELGNKKGHYEVRFMPGTKNISTNSQTKWRESKEILEKLLDKENFWSKKVKESFRRGLRFVRSSNQKHGLCQVRNDWKKLKEENKKVDGQFGSKAQKIKNGMCFAGKFLGRAGFSVCGTALGLAYAGIAPVARIVYVPVAAGTKAVFTGTLWPALQYVWNGTAWLIVKGNEAPEGSTMTVSYIPNEGLGS